MERPVSMPTKTGQNRLKACEPLFARRGGRSRLRLQDLRADVSHNLRPTLASAKAERSASLNAAGRERDERF